MNTENFPDYTRYYIVSKHNELFLLTCLGPECPLDSNPRLATTHSWSDSSWCDGSCGRYRHEP